MGGGNRKFDAQFASLCGRTYNCLSRSVPEIHLHVVGTLSNKQTNNQQTSLLKQKQSLFIYEWHNERPCQNQHCGNEWANGQSITVDIISGLQAGRAEVLRGLRNFHRKARASQHSGKEE